MQTQSINETPEVSLENDIQPIVEEIIFTDQIITCLKFVDSYSSGIPSPFSPEVLLEMYEARHLGLSYTELAYMYATQPCSVVDGLRRVENAIGHATKSPKTSSTCETRIQKIQTGLETLPSFIAHHKRKKTETWDLLVANPCFTELLFHLSNGNTIEELIGGIPRERGDWWIHPIKQSILNACTGKAKATNNPNVLIQIKLFRDYLAHHTNLANRRLGPKHYEIIFRIMDYSIDTTGNVAQRISRIRSFFELCTLIDFYTENTNNWDPSQLELYFPGIKYKEPFSINHRRYYENQFEAGLIPKGIKMAMLSAITGQQNVFLDILVKHTRYKPSTIEGLLTTGLYFLQNLLAIKYNWKPIDLERLLRNPKVDTRRILGQIFFERQNTLQIKP